MKGDFFNGLMTGLFAAFIVWGYSLMMIETGKLDAVADLKSRGMICSK